MGAPGLAAWDDWSTIHVMAGAALGALGVGVVGAVVVLVGFEVFEAGLRASSSAGGPGLLEPESRRNIGADLAAGLAGYVGGRVLL